MNNKHKKILTRIFKTPIDSGILWKDIEILFLTLGAAIEEGSGSRVRVSLNGIDAIFHRPHPRKETDKGALKSVRRFLLEANINLNKPLEK